ncbi:galactose-1-phosphate uridylyltransferase, partial [bacterium]|nr:galactose-1-phosphate uridylyltransferase [bacterium]
ENEAFVAFTFFASRFPFETWILPKEHRQFFEKEDKTQRLLLAEVFLQVLKMLASRLKDPDYNFYINTTPPREESRGLAYNIWHIEIVPRLSKMGGYELGAGIFVDVVSPEKAASFLRGEIEK